jgi:hypothetical protein
VRAGEQQRLEGEKAVRVEEVEELPLFRCQYLYFCTSTASNLRLEGEEAVGVEEVEELPEKIEHAVLSLLALLVQKYTY